MRVVHEPGGEARTLASTVETADSGLEHAKGLMFRESIPDDYALVFEFEGPPFFVPGTLANWRSIHMVFVRFPIDVIWVLDAEVQQVKTLRPWRGLGMAKADTVLELPAGAAEEVEPGDTVTVEGE